MNSETVHELTGEGSTIKMYPASLVVHIQTGLLKLYVWDENTLSLKFSNISVFKPLNHWNLPMFMSEWVCLLPT